MTNDSKRDLPDVSAWEVANLRLTAFPATSPEGGGGGWWAQLVGEEPASRTEKPKLGQEKVEGPFANGVLTLGLALGRIDWILQPPMSPEPPEGLPTLGLLPEVHPEFIALGQKWMALDSCPELQRIALGAVLLQPVEDRRFGYSLLDRYLPSVDLDSENSRGFLYQINRPRCGPVKNVAINRLSRWSVHTMSVVSMEVAESQIKPLPTGGQSFVSCRLEMDINTDVDFQGTFLREEASEVLRTLVDFATEIAGEGDKP